MGNSPMIEGGNASVSVSDLEGAVVKLALFEDPDGNDLYLCEVP